MPERLGAAYGIKAGKSQDPTQHYQSRPNGPMLRQPSPTGSVGSPSGMVGNPGMVPSPRPIKGGGTGGMLQPITPRPPRGGGIMNPRPTPGGSGPIMAPPRNGGPVVGGGNPKQPKPLPMPTVPGGGGAWQGGTKYPRNGGGMAHPIGSMPAKQQPGRAPAHYGPIQANTGTGSTKRPLQQALGQGSGRAPSKGAMSGSVKGGGAGYAPPQPGLMTPKLPTVGSPRKR